MRVTGPRLAALLAGALVLAGCGGADPDSAQQIIDQANAMPLVTTINGQVPPGEPALVHTSTLELDVMRDGQEVRVYRDVRQPGTRAPIHVHPFGGWTCVVSGQAVLYLDGAEPATVTAGQCVNMPALTPMSNVNPGPGPSVLLDNFVTPPGAPIWRIVEEGQQHLGDEFATGDAERVNPE